MIRLVLDFQRAVLRDLCGEFGHAEADGCEVVACAFPNAFGRGVHDVEGGLDGIVHVDHGETGFSTDEAFVFAGSEGAVEDSDGVIGGSSPGQLLPADNAWVSEAADIKAISVIVVLSEQLPCIFGDSIHRCGFYGCMLRSIFFRGCWPKHCH